MVKATKATVAEDAETVADNAADVETVEADTEIVASRIIMVVVIAPIRTIMKSAATTNGKYTAGHMGISPINPINATLPTMDIKARQR